MVLWTMKRTRRTKKPGASPPEQLPTDGKKPTPSSQMFGKRSAYTQLSVLVAVGHYLSYVYLDGRELDDVVLPQTWVIRVGNAFAFLFKLTLVSAIGVAVRKASGFLSGEKTLKFGLLTQCLASYTTQPCS